jgi:two-component system cell cycle response regulator DivK
MLYPKDTIQNRLDQSHLGHEHSLPSDCTVLIVEDNVSNYVLITRMLGPMGVYCDWKTSGYEVVEFANSLPHIDLILMNMLLPYEDGLHALRKIRTSKRLQGIPIIAMAVEASLELMDKARVSGFDGFLGKPLSPDRFPDQIYNILCGDSVWELK